MGAGATFDRIIVADGNNALVADGKRGGGGVLRIHGDDLRVQHDQTCTRAIGREERRCAEQSAKTCQCAYNAGPMNHSFPRLRKSAAPKLLSWRRKLYRILLAAQAHVAESGCTRLRALGAACSLTILFVLPGPVLAAPAVAADAALVLSHATVIDVASGALQPDQAVVIEGDRIISIGPSAKARLPKGAQVVDVTGKFLIPGLWDMHVHTIFGDWLPKDEKIILPLFVANGITGVRDMGGDLEELKVWRAQIAAGKLLGPRMVISGPMLDGPVPRFPSSAPVKNAADGKRIVDELKKSGADFIKIQSLIPRDGYFAAADEAKKLGIPFVGHVPDAVRASEAANAGQRSVEHFTGVFEGCSTIEDQLMTGPKGPGRFVETYDPAHAQVLIALFAKNQTWQVPTLVWEHGQWLIDESDFSHDPLTKYAPAAWKDRTWPMFTKDILKDMDTDPLPVRERFTQMELEMVNRMHKAGVPFLAGTDTAAGVHVFPGFSLHEELTYFVKAGLTPLEALQTATRNPALFFGKTADLGSVEPGKLADLVLLDANPLDDIHNTQKIRAVVLAGHYLSRERLNAMLHEVETSAAASK
jgi:imidazolonepropionase-like amidohydrolase